MNKGKNQKKFENKTFNNKAKQISPKGKKTEEKKNFTTTKKKIPEDSEKDNGYIEEVPVEEFNNNKNVFLKNNKKIEENVSDDSVDSEDSDGDSDSDDSDSGDSDSESGDEKIKLNSKMENVGKIGNLPKMENLKKIENGAKMENGKKIGNLVKMGNGKKIENNNAKMPNIGKIGNFPKIENGKKITNIDDVGKKEDLKPENGVDKKRKRDDDNGEKNGAKKKVKLDGTRMVTIDVDDEDVPISNFRISESTQKILEENGYKTLWPIQSKTYDLIYDGSDLVGRARTGTGKTLSFGLPIIEKILLETPSSVRSRGPRLLVIAPTRELAQQVERVLKLLCQNLVSLCIYGGIPYDSQEKMLFRGVDIVVGTPGRILDHIEKTNLKLDNLKYFVCDEADQMLNMGFKEDIDAILQSIPEITTVQKLLFSATIPIWVRKIALTFMKPDYITVDLVSNEDITQTAIGVRHLAVLMDTHNFSILGDIVQIYSNGGKVIIFCDTKKEATQIGLMPSLSGICQVIHGDFTQASRDTTMTAFRNNNFQVLVATDVAARGLDIEGVDLVIQTAPPKNGYEQYIHRSGRTGRAGKEGTCVTLVNKKFKNQINEIEDKAKITFIWIKEPGPQALYEAAGKRSVSFIEKIDPAIISHFLPLSASLVETFNGDTSRALAASLAYASGFSHQRSLLGRLYNYDTILIKDAQLNFFSPPAIKNFILSLLTAEESKKAKAIGQIRKSVNGDLVVDVPSEILPSLLAHSQKKDKKAVITKLSELPLLNADVWRGFRENSGGGSRFRENGGGGSRFGGDRFRKGGGGGGFRSGRGGGGDKQGFRSGRGGRGGRGDGARGRGMMKKFSWST